MAEEGWEIIADFVAPCPYCGVPCSGTFRVWYSDGDRRRAFEMERGSLLVALEQLVGAAIERSEYDSLPAFVQEWNEARGWAEFASDGALVAADDLLRTVDLLDQQRSGTDVRGAKILDGLRTFVTQANQEGREVWATET